MKKPLIYRGKVDSCQFFGMETYEKRHFEQKSGNIHMFTTTPILIPELLVFISCDVFKRNMFQKSSIKTRSSAIEVSIQNFVDCAERQTLNIRFDLPTLKCRLFDFADAANMQTSYFQLILFP